MAAVRLAMLLPALLVAGTIAGGAAGAAGAQSTPEELVRAYNDAVARSDLAEAARLTHPSALQQIRQLVAGMARRDTTGRALQGVAGVSSAAELAALPDTVLYARFLGAIMRQQPAMRDVMRGSRAEVIGHVVEGGTTAHVVYRLHLTVNGVAMSRLSVLSAQRVGGVWRALLSGDISGMVEAMNRAGGGAGG
jgi:hypothetical protein